MYALIYLTIADTPSENSLALAQVQKKMLQDAKKRKIAYEILDRKTGLFGSTIEAALILFSGSNLKSFVKDWVGTILWKGSGEGGGRSMYLLVAQIELENRLIIAEKDITYQTTRSQGPGGQNVNKVNTAVRATHTPTGIFVLAMDSRSQAENKSLALKRLEDKVLFSQTQDLKDLLTHKLTLSLKVNPAKLVKTIEGTNFKPKYISDPNKNQKTEANKEIRSYLNRSTKDLPADD